MRLTCPKCGAQYEVPDTAVPEQGRDVQCSNCGSTWFQARGQMTGPFRPAAVQDPAASASQGGPAPAPGLQTPAFSSDNSDAATAPDTGAAPRDDTPDDAPATTVPPRPRRQIDPAVLDVLREEAAYETRARDTPRPDMPRAGMAPPASGPVTPPSNSTPPPAPRSRPSAADGPAMAPLQADPTEAAATPPATVPPAAVPSASPAPTAVPKNAVTTRRNLLPDIDDVDSSLSTAPGRPLSEEPAQDTPRKLRKIFWIGVFVPLVIAAIAVAIYLNAARISVTVPAVSPVIDSYAAEIDTARQWLAEVLARVQTSR